MSLARAEWLRDHDPDEYVRRSLSSMRAHCEAIVAMQEAGAVAVDYGNNLRGFALEAGLEDAFAYPGFGVVRHADAGYPAAIETAGGERIRIPMLEKPGSLPQAGLRYPAPQRVRAREDSEAPLYCAKRGHFY